MIQETYQKAMKFAGEAHANQQVPGTNANYLLHISNVAMEVLIAYQNKPDFDILLAIQVAILHDIIEDCEAINYNVIKNEFGEQVANAVQALTKDSNKPKNEQMADSITKIKARPKEIAIVKLADRITNLQKPPNNEKWTNEKISNYYNQAKYIAESLKGVNAYLDTRINEQLNKYKSYFS